MTLAMVVNFSHKMTSILKPSLIVPEDKSYQVSGRIIQAGSLNFHIVSNAKCKPESVKTGSGICQKDRKNSLQGSWTDLTPEHHNQYPPLRKILLPRAFCRKGLPGLFQCYLQFSGVFAPDRWSPPFSGGNQSNAPVAVFSRIQALTLVFSCICFCRFQS